MSKNNDDYQFGYTNTELERLGTQHKVWEETTKLLWKRTGFQTGMTIVDLGCGPGYTTIDLAELVGPSGHIIAVDRDSEKSLPLLKSKLTEEAIKNVEIRALDLEKLDLPSESVDGVYGRWVMMYLDPKKVEAIVVRATKWLRWGGAFVLVEFCNYNHMCVYPSIQLMATVAKAFYQSVTAHGGCPNIGNSLPGIMRSAGLDVDLNVIIQAIQSNTQKWAWPDSFLRDHVWSLVEEKHLKIQQYEKFINEWQARCDDPESIFFSSPVMEAIGKKLK